MNRMFSGLIGVLVAAFLCVLGATFATQTYAADRTEHKLTDADITPGSKCGASAVGQRRVGKTEIRIQRRQEPTKFVNDDGFWDTCKPDPDCRNRLIGTLPFDGRRVLGTPNLLKDGMFGDTRIVKFGFVGSNVNMAIAEAKFMCTLTGWRQVTPITERSK